MNVFDENFLDLCDDIVLMQSGTGLEEWLDEEIENIDRESKDRIFCFQSGNLDENSLC